MRRDLILYKAKLTPYEIGVMFPKLISLEPLLLYDFLLSLHSMHCLRLGPGEDTPTLPVDVSHMFLILSTSALSSRHTT